MTDRRLAGAATLVLAVAGLAPGQDGDQVARLEALGRALPRLTGLTAVHVAELERLADELPASLHRDETTALGALLAVLGPRTLDAVAAPALGPRMLAWCRRMLARPALPLAHASYLELVAGEAHFAVADSDAAVAAFHRAAALAAQVGDGDWTPKAVAWAHERAFRVELSRQRLAAAKRELEAGRQPDPLRRHLAWAQLQLRIGLFDSAARSLALAEQEVATHPAQERADERQTLLLIAIELALLREDHDLVEALAVRLEARGGHEFVVARARLRRQQARIARGEAVPLAPLQQLLAMASPLNRPAVALDLVAHALRIGADDVAAEVVTSLLAGRALLDPTVDLWTLLTAAQHELRPAAMATIAPARLREWDAALSHAWRQLIDEWHAVAPDGESLAFLQMGVRRDVLGLWLRTQPATPAAARGAVQRFLEADASGSIARRLGHAPADVDAVLAALVPERGALLVFLPAAVGSHVLYLAHDEVRVVPLPPEERLRERAFALRRAMTAGDGVGDGAAAIASSREVAASLASDLLPPGLLALLRDKHQVLVAGYELLHALPLEWLPIAEEPGWFGLRHALGYVPSITLAMHLAARTPPPAQERMVVLAGTHLAAADQQRWGKEPVRVVDAEVRAALAGVADAALDVRLAATPADLAARRGDSRIAAVAKVGSDAGADADGAPVAASAARPAFVVVLAHGVHDAARACPGGILLAPSAGAASGALFASELPGAGAPRVLFLGVCGAARSPLRLGEDGGHRLTSAFLLAGSDAVIATDFDVRLDEVLQLLAPFAAALADGQCAADALLHARRTTAAAGAHPRVWGTMRLEGLPGARAALPRAAAGAAGTGWAGGTTWALVVAAALGGVLLTFVALRARRRR